MNSEKDIEKCRGNQGDDDDIEELIDVQYEIDEICPNITIAEELDKICENMAEKNVKWDDDTHNELSNAIEKFSYKLADDLIQEALLIHEFYKRDKFNVKDSVQYDMDNSRKFGEDLGNDKDQLTNIWNNSKCDAYLIEKLLQSEAGPDEESQGAEFDAIRENCVRKFETLKDRHNKEIHIKAVTDTQEISDDNNNRVGPVPVHPLSEDILQTIQENAELVVKEKLTFDNTGDLNIEPVDTERACEQNTAGVDCGNNNPENARSKIDFEDEPECCEMTIKLKQAVVDAVRGGDITRLDALLQEKNADMNMQWYGENLLMVAIRARQQEMAGFLVDNGIDRQCSSKRLEVDANDAFSVHTVTARQMAYDANMDELVELLDYKSHNLFPFIKAKSRIHRLRMPITPFVPAPLDESLTEEVLLQSEGLSPANENHDRTRVKLTHKKKRRTRSRSGTENDSVYSSKSGKSNLNSSIDEITQVFGPDEGYDTMSTVSPFPPHRHEFDIAELKEPVSIRGTRASFSIRAYNLSKTDYLKHKDVYEMPISNDGIRTVGSYNFESRRWHQLPRSAPQLKNYSLESLPNATVLTGVPFVHGFARSIPYTYTASGHTQHHRRVKSAHENLSTYSQVYKLLEGSEMLSSKLLSRASTPHLPVINRTYIKRDLTKTRINYIYAERRSAGPRPRLANSTKQQFGRDLLPKRKLKC